MRAFVYGVLGTALLQGVPAGLGFMVAGVHGAVLLGFLTFVVAVIPGGPVLVAVDLVSARTQSIRGKTGAPCGIRLPRR
jgi:predicted PurR-regulated permease PerM